MNEIYLHLVYDAARPGHFEFSQAVASWIQRNRLVYPNLVGAVFQDASNQTSSSSGVFNSQVLVLSSDAQPAVFLYARPPGQQRFVECEVLSRQTTQVTFLLDQAVRRCISADLTVATTGNGNGDGNTDGSNGINPFLDVGIDNLVNIYKAFPTWLIIGLAVGSAVKANRSKTIIGQTGYSAAAFVFGTEASRRLTS